MLKPTAEIQVYSGLVFTFAFALALVRFSHQPQEFASSFDWFTGLAVSFLPDPTDNFKVGFTTLN